MESSVSPVLNGDTAKKTNILSITKLNDLHKLLEAHFGPEWKSNWKLKIYTKLSLRNPEDQFDESDPYIDQGLWEDVTKIV